MLWTRFRRKTWGNNSSKGTVVLKAACLGWCLLWFCVKWLWLAVPLKWHPPLHCAEQPHTELATPRVVAVWGHVGWLRPSSHLQSTQKQAEFITVRLQQSQLQTAKPERCLPTMVTSRAVCRRQKSFRSIIYRKIFLENNPGSHFLLHTLWWNLLNMIFSWFVFNLKKINFQTLPSYISFVSVLVIIILNLVLLFQARFL